MKRSQALTLALAIALIPFALTPACRAQKVSLPSLAKGPMRLMPKMPPSPLLRKFGKPVFGKVAPTAMGVSNSPTLGNQIAFMQQVNNQGNKNVANIYKACVSHPGACNGLASQASVSDAIQGVQNQSLINSQHQMVNQDVQTQAVGQTNCALTGGQVVWNNTLQRKECSR